MQIRRHDSLLLIHLSNQPGRVLISFMRKLLMLITVLPTLQGLTYLGSEWASNPIVRKDIVVGQVCDLELGWWQLGL